MIALLADKPESHDEPTSRFATALDDVTVLDLTRVRAGPTCVRPACGLGRDRHQDRDA